jgi:AraC family transcriptional activator of tynA and feaB
VARGPPTGAEGKIVVPKSPSWAERAGRGPAGLQPGEYWRARICDALPGLSIDWLEDGPIRAQVNSWRFADAGIVEIADPPIQVARRIHPGSMDHGYKLALHLAGHGCYRYSGNEFFQMPGDLVLLDTEISFEVVHPAGAHVLIWELSRKELAWLLARPEGCRLIRGCDGMGAVLGSYMKMLTNETERLTDTAQRNLHTHLCTLVALALGSAPAVPAEKHRTARRAVQCQRILAYIEAHLCDPHVTAERAARDLAMSRRWLHALLDANGEGFSARVTRRRLEESCKLLHDPACDHLSIAEIAFLVGFNDVSTFHRRFRHYSGMTPNQLRHLRS